MQAEMQDCHMSARHGDAAKDHNDTNDSNNNTDAVDKLTAYGQKPLIKESQERVHSLFIFFHLLLSLLSVCWEDELGMAEPLHRLLAKGSRGEGPG